MTNTALLIKNFDKPGKYRADMPRRVMQDMAQGKTYLQASITIGINPATLSEWTNPNSNVYRPALAKALQLGRALSEDWWLEQGRLALESKNGFNHVLWYMNMKNRFGWRDTVDLTSNGESINFINAVPRPVIDSDVTPAPTIAPQLSGTVPSPSSPHK